MKILIIIILFVVALLSSFFLGARIGAIEFTYWDAQYRASILTYEIKALKNGEVEKIISSKEIQLNDQLAKHGDYLESKFNWLSPELSNRDDSPIINAVSYRISNPYKEPDIANTDNWNPEINLKSQENQQFLEDLIKGKKESDRLIYKVLDKYKQTTVNQPIPTER